MKEVGLGGGIGWCWVVRKESYSEVFFNCRGFFVIVVFGLFGYTFVSWEGIVVDIV